MGMISKALSRLYKIGKLGCDIKAISSGDPRKIARRLLRRKAGGMSSKGLGKLFRL